MRKIFLIVFLLFAFFVESTVQAQTIKEVIEGVPVLPTPTANVPKQSQKWIYIQKEDRKFPDIIYRDFQRTKPETYSDPDKEEFCVGCFQFRKPGNSNYTTLGVNVGQSDARNMLLVTYDFNANQIDWVEVEVKFSDIKLKQYKITPEMKLFVYELKPTSPTPIYFYEDYIQKKISSLNAQRIDTVYQIDDNGKVNKLSEKKYQPKDYSMTILETADIWNGNETPLQ